MMESSSGVPLVLLFVVSMLSLVSCQREGYCLASDYDPYLKFSTMSAYEFIKGKDNNQHRVPYCQPVQFWSFNRHGTRLPGKNSMETLPKLENVRNDVISNYEVRRIAPDQGRMCQQDLDNLKTWYWNKNFTRNFAFDITYQGYDDIKYLAKRWQSRFPGLLSSTYSPRDFQFRYTDQRRSKESYRAFADGLFGREAIDNVRASPTEANDTVLNSYQFCKAWIDEVKDNPTTQQQVELFTKKEEYQTMIQNVSNHLGFKYALDQAVIEDIYKMCAYDKAWEINRNSPWCSAFTKEQLMLLEYKEDLRYFYSAGYGNKEANQRLGCTPLQDLMHKFTKMVEHPEQDQSKVTVYFTHSQMLLSLVTALGISEDSVPLTSDNYHTPNMQRRSWRTSQIDPFAANLVAVLYRCEEGDKHRVMFFLNERPVELAGCSVGLCSWDWVKQKYSAAANKCNLDYCHGNTAHSTQATAAILILTSMFLRLLRQ